MIENIQTLIDLSFREDLSDEGDHSAKASIPSSARDKAQLLVKGDGVIAGIELAQLIFKHFDKDVEFDVLLEDGDHVQHRDVAFYVTGSAHTLLSVERIVLNFMQRMSGIATTTRKYVDLIADTKAKVLDTRKTTPGLREIEKWAVRIGGGHNHRMGLYDMIMLKDNHIDYAGGIQQAISSTNRYIAKHNLDIAVEIETRSIEEVKEVLEIGGVNRIMLDNFSPKGVEQAVQLIDGEFETEASGGITLDTIRSYAITGVDYISVGALTHSYESLDLSLKAVQD